MAGWVSQWQMDIYCYQCNGMPPQSGTLYAKWALASHEYRSVCPLLILASEVQSYLTDLSVTGRIYLSAQVLATGIVLADLPGSIPSCCFAGLGR